MENVYIKVSQVVYKLTCYTGDIQVNAALMV